MSRIEVDPLSLTALGQKLKAAARVAGLVERFGHHFDFPEHTFGDRRFTGALCGFTRRWSYGAGFLADDATALADLLSRAGAVYLDVETKLAQAAS